jgi:hypothetical protein
MKVRFMKAAESTPSAVIAEQDEFEIVLVAELELLRKRECVLQRVYPRLGGKPHLRGWFLRELAEVQQRAHRLEGVINPIGALQFAQSVASTANRSVA